jgi:hypothetical protein
MASTPRPAQIALGGVLLCVPVLLGVLAFPRFLAGARVEPFHNVITQAELGQKLPPSIYRAAADALAGAPDADGQSQSDRARALVLSADKDPATIAQSRVLVVRALLDGPSNANAWTLLCQIDARRTPQAGVACLDNAFTISPYDWYTADWRMNLVASEWPYLDERVRDQAVSLILPMWSLVWPQDDTVTLRGVLYDLSFTEDGRQLLRAGFAGHRNDLRDFNRYVIEKNADVQ